MANTSSTAQLPFKQIRGMDTSPYLDQSGGKVYVTLSYTSGTNAYNGTLNPPVTSYNVGLCITAKVGIANNATNPTLSINGLGAVAIYKNNGTALEIGDLQPGYYTFVYGSSAFYLEGTPLQAATDAETQVGSNASGTKFLTPARLLAWWAWQKTQAQTFLGKLTISSVFKLNTAINNTPSIGDIYNDGNGLRHFTNQSVLTYLLHKEGNQSFIGSTTRQLQVNANGDLIAPNDIIDGVITDPDIIAAITTANFNSGNYFTATIVPANSKIAYQGQEYYPDNNIYYYKLKANNIVLRIPLG